MYIIITIDDLFLMGLLHPLRFNVSFVEEYIGYADGGVLPLVNLLQNLFWEPFAGFLIVYSTTVRMTGNSRKPNCVTFLHFCNFRGKHIFQSDKTTV